MNFENFEDKDESEIPSEEKNIESKKKPDFSPGEYLGKKYPDLKKSEAVELSHKYSEDKERNKVDTWLKNMEGFHERNRDNEIEMDMIRDAFHNEYIIKEEDIPQSYFENQQRIARERGHGNVEIDKEQAIDVIISDQKSTLDNWTNYILSKDSDSYPMWAKYWAFRSMTKLSSYDKENKSFGTRRKDTVAPFPDLNREALAYVVDAIVKKANKENIGTEENNPELEKLIQSENFGKLYAFAIEKVTPTETNELANTEGEWRKYDQKSDHMPLVESLQGYGTGWCTAGESTAESQLKNGDFYVFYSKDKEGEYTIPRVAIRMQGSEIGEVRGIGPNQNLDPYIGEIVNKKLKEFPGGKEYEKKTGDMQFLTLIEEKQNKNQKLTKEELCFLYELDSKIEGFGYQRDPRIEEIRNKRDLKNDLSLATGYPKEKITTKQEEALSGDFLFFNGNLDLRDLTSNEGLKLPEIMNGELDLSSLTSAEGLNLPKTVNGDLILSSLNSTEGLKLPEIMNGELILSSLTSAEGLNLPKTVNGGLCLSSLTSAEGLELPETINGDLILSSLNSTEGLKLPKKVNRCLDLSGLTSAEGLNLPETVNGFLSLYSLTSTKGLKLPKTVNGGLYLSSLTSAEGLELPEIMNGDLILSSLTSAEGLELPETVNGDTYLNNLSSDEKDILRNKYPNLNIY
ncbi:MAG: hypothetical protein WC122_01220 [archaeon]